MADHPKSFFTSLTGLITGLATLLTAGVAFFGVAVNQGWLSSSSRPTTSATSATTGTSGTTATGGTATTASTTSGTTAHYAVSPDSLTFNALGPATAAVRVDNAGDSPMTVEPATLTGSGADHFSVDDSQCTTAPVDPGRTCQVQVTFHHASGTFPATLVIQVTGAVRATEVPVTATAVL